ncbi:PH domain-containing protein [Ureibacillus manganicus]|uniref:Membrane protein n=1 Tax=Ureibacillus manganicus DSM 26584 TaxID=1384049 RepID=A0A0A3HTV8_9BACL|nr:PH domain-containing protein [Ureibacillus manganicus]KGR75859.1 membrane protein [Ureibacillus manganicus DSM 26584]
MRKEPSHKIPRKGLTVWRLYGVISTIIVLVLAGVVSFLTYRFLWPTFIYYIAIGLFILNAIFSIWIVPNIRWDHWRYEVREHEIEIQSGLFVVKRTMIPMVRVQHVDTAQGPILKKYNLANIAISTAATTHMIPMLLSDDADNLRSRISELARVAEDDV